METTILASVYIEWDQHGNISHTLQSFVPVNDYKKADALALSAALLFSSQLGVLSPNYAVFLCQQAFGFLGFEQQPPEVIERPLCSARIDLVQTGQSIVATFYPEIVAEGAMEMEESVCKLIINYLHYVENNVTPDIVEYLRSIVLMSISYYLTMALPIELDSPSFNPRQVSPKLNLSMVEFTCSIYPQWQKGPAVPATRYNVKMTETNRQLESVFQRLK